MEGEKWGAPGGGRVASDEGHCNVGCNGQTGVRRADGKRVATLIQGRGDYSLNDYQSGG